MATVIAVSILVKEIQAKSILSKSKIFDYTINAYIGCQHGCTYCYARFIKRFTGHKEEWGKFVDVKTNAADLLKHEIAKKEPRRVWISGLCDAYQPIEKRYRITRACLEVLAEHDWPVTIQTKSPLVTRDLDLLKKLSDLEVGFSIGTGSEKIGELFEPNVPSIRQRIQTLGQLCREGVKTFAMIAPLLPKAEDLPSQLIGNVDRVLIDKMNYHHADWVYRENELEIALTDDYRNRQKRELVASLTERNIPYRVLF